MDENEACKHTYVKKDLRTLILAHILFWTIQTSASPPGAVDDVTATVAKLGSHTNIYYDLHFIFT